MKQFCFLVAFICSLHTGYSQRSRFEISKGKETATYFEIIQWYRDLDRISPQLQLLDMGQTDAGYPLHLAVLSPDRTFDPIQWHKHNKVVVLINNGIHPGEPDGIDASMLLARDIIKGKIILPANVVVAFIPVYNIGGCLNRNAHTRVNQNGPLEYGFRGNSQNLDLNRDFTKMDSREARTFVKLYHYLNPDILIDNHVSDGADFQHTMTLLTTQYEKLDSALGNWLKLRLEPAVYRDMSVKGWDMLPYVDFQSTDIKKGMKMFYDPPRYSSGFAALFQTIGFVPETHMLKPFDKRVKSTYDLMVSFLQVAGKQGTEIKQKRREAIKSVITRQRFPLKWIADTAASRQVRFQGYETDSTFSEATGLKKLVYDHNRPFTRAIPFFDTYLPASEVQKPRAYILPQGWHEVAERLKLNKVQMKPLAKDTIIEVTTYRVEEYNSYTTPYEKHHKNFNVHVVPNTRKLKFLAGDHIIYLNQAANRYIVEMLEPTGDDSFFAWNFFDGILQQKEGYSDYRWEDLAATVLKNDTALREDLDQKKRSDSAFRNNASEILSYIYYRSPYYERAHREYPVYRVEL